MKYVLVSGGVISGVGKGIIASSTGIDPYLNVDAGTMSPTEHGEAYVLDDGGEVDLDLGNYERYLNVTLTREHNITTGKMYNHVITGERRGDYLGRTVQIVPHLTNAIRDWIERVAKIPVDDTKSEPDACVIELGGTVGDIEGSPFLESLTQLRRRAGKHTDSENSDDSDDSEDSKPNLHNFLHIHVSYIPVLVTGEQKTKPTQQTIGAVRKEGFRPDLIACRSDVPLKDSTAAKVAQFCQVNRSRVIGVHNVPSTYQVPMLLESQNFVPLLRKILRLDALKIPPSLASKGAQNWSAWKRLTIPQDHLYETVTIALVGKYDNFRDAYHSVIKSLEHAAMACYRKLNLVWIDASHLEPASQESSPDVFDKAWQNLRAAGGILVPGGFGKRGTEGMIMAAKWAREKKTPYLGICFGMQLAVIEFARNVCKIPTASSAEFEEETPDPLIIFMPEIDPNNKGGTMRLGLKPTHFQPGTEWSKLRVLYQHNIPPATKSSDLPNGTVQANSSDGSKEPAPLIILERHRHRYEVNPAYLDTLASHGLTFVGKDENGKRMEILELKDHPWFVGVQFHPELLSRVLRSSKPFLGFIAAASGCLAELLERGEITKRKIEEVEEDSRPEKRQRNRKLGD